MKILFLTSRFPFPLEKGDKLRAYYQIKELSRSHEIILVAVSDQVVSRKQLEALKPFCKKMIVHQISFAKILWNLSMTLFSRLPFQVGYFFSKIFKRKVDSFIADEKPDVILCQLVRMAEYVRDNSSIPKTLDYMDAFSTGLERLSERSSFFKKMIVRMEWKRMMKYEQEIFFSFRHCTIISEQDKKLIPHPEHEKIHVIPNGVDFDFYHPLEREKKYEIDSRISNYSTMFSSRSSFCWIPASRLARSPLIPPFDSTDGPLKIRVH